MAAEAGQSQQDKLLRRVRSANTVFGNFLDTQALAAAGSAQTDAGAVSVLSGGLVVVSAADATKGIILPTPTNGDESPDGYWVIVKNNVNAVLKVYPHVGSAVNALSGDAAISQAALTCAIYAYFATTGKWYTLPLLPS